jgi:hypothetical protein
MADLGKNGYNWTGYTEPFVLTEPISQGEPLAKVGGWGSITVDGGVTIEETEFKNSGLFVRVHSITSTTVFISKSINFDVRKDPTYNSTGRFVITDGVDQATVDSVVYDNVTKEYTVTLLTPLTLTLHKGYRVIGRVVDVGDLVATRDYEVGDVIYEASPTIGGETPPVGGFNGTPSLTLYPALDLYPQEVV